LQIYLKKKCLEFIKNHQHQLLDEHQLHNLELLILPYQQLDGHQLHNLDLLLLPYQQLDGHQLHNLDLLLLPHQQLEVLEHQYVVKPCVLSYLEMIM
jgi:hypothetical protein